ncbi:unnamed protein product [Fasciola hepatica]|uniref:Uncharacterized protein n=1 Tax=Fasciola hepatica TaxID=6192 RepID=A0ABC9HFS6_FASHE|nr:unnamed protein product [Fasciola hepatica]
MHDFDFDRINWQVIAKCSSQQTFGISLQKLLLSFPSESVVGSLGCLFAPGCLILPQKEDLLQAANNRISSLDQRVTALAARWLPESVPFTLIITAGADKEPDIEAMKDSGKPNLPNFPGSSEWKKLSKDPGNPRANFHLDSLP